MVSCCICLDDNASLPLLSCFQCQLCLHCHQELQSNPTELRCSCDRSGPIILIPAGPVTSENDSLSPGDVAYFIHVVSQTHGKVAKLAKQLKHTISQLTQQKNTAYKRILFRLQCQVSYLPSELAKDRAEKLSQELIWYNQAVIKAHQIEIKTLEELIYTHEAILARFGQMTELVNPTKQIRDWYYDIFHSQTNQALTTATALKSTILHDVVVYAEISPINLDLIGQVVPVYDEVTKSGYIFKRNPKTGKVWQKASLAEIEVYRNGKRHGRWQVVEQRNLREDHYYLDDYLLKNLSYFLYSSANIPAWSLRIHDWDRFRDSKQTLRHYWSFRNYRYYSGILDGPMLQSLLKVDGELTDWCYWLKEYFDVSVENNHRDYFQSGYYQDGKLIETME